MPPRSSITTNPFCKSLPVVVSNRATALSVALAGPTTSPHAELFCQMADVALVAVSTWPILGGAAPETTTAATVVWSEGVPSAIRSSTYTFVAASSSFTGVPTFVTWLVIISMSSVTKSPSNVGADDELSDWSSVLTLTQLFNTIEGAFSEFGYSILSRFRTTFLGNGVYV